MTEPNAPGNSAGDAPGNAKPKPQKSPYKKTLNLPKTAFPMKANLVQNEAASQKRWDKLGLYAKLRERAAQAEADGNPLPPFVFHDGPPYANGDIHLGHLLNKCLKDFVVRSQTLLGHDCPYTPGWDCHGLPIEHKVMQDLGDAARTMEPIKIRQKCKTYAEKFVKTQSKQMQRLLTMADYDDPYLTMAPKYEAGVLEVFAGLVEKGVVYRDLKPVHWSIDNQTALAEAELEYYDREDTSVFVKFDCVGKDDQSLMIWTTTPWTLPANLAVAVHERYEYGLYQAGDRKVVLACELAAKVLAHGGIDSAEPLETFPGRDLLGVEYTHPFVDRVGKVFHAEYVTLEDGTGLVHTAPGHGAEDYQTGLREGLDVYCPVRADGTYDDTVPDWLQGESIWKANDMVVERLRESGHLFHDQKFLHSYPHDWRGKKPIIFRATEQWFVGVDREIEGLAGGPKGPTSMRDAALRVTESDVDFLPGWGRNRMRGMLESRPDWCISRQRSWGLPIPAFFKEDGTALLNPASVRAVAKVFAEKGSDAWFYMSPEDLLAYYDEDGLDKSTLTKGKDTFDVWFESGSSWNAVLREGWRDKQTGGASGGYPADLYLEGSDQHRGWFQHSLLPALAVTGQSPFKTVLTHGFMVDKDGKKMSKSGGNALKIEDLFKDYGADVCRWWVASLNPDNDIKVDMSFFKLAGEEYRKVRNTLRFLLSNLDDFNPDDESNYCRIEKSDSTSLDAWALKQTKELLSTVKSCYEGYQFRKATEAIYHFCNDTMSSIYLAAVKDRLYCDAVDSPRRRRTQTACYRITAVLCQMLAPVLPHTADEAWNALPKTNNPPSEFDHCVHLSTLPEPSMWYASSADERWAEAMKQRDTWLKTLEDFRQSQGIDNPLDLSLHTPEDWSGFDPDDLADLCGISRFVYSAPELTAEDLSYEPRCERSWKRDGTVKQRADGGMLSDRDAAALGLE
ncbi:MAG: isoleucine--tRNA ligase [Planctomycetota bacterium]